MISGMGISHATCEPRPLLMRVFDTVPGTSPSWTESPPPPKADPIQRRSDLFATEADEKKKKDKAQRLK